MVNPRELAIEKAAQCWCDERTSKTVMDTDLCQVFAEQLEEQMTKADKLAEAIERVVRHPDMVHSLDYEVLAEALEEYQG
jgi:hypothetical protein